MRHFLLVDNTSDVLGVWELEDERAISRLKLKLSLSFPGCRTIVAKAQDFEAFKAKYRDYDYTGVTPELFSAA